MMCGTRLSDCILYFVWDLIFIVQCQFSHSKCQENVSVYSVYKPVSYHMHLSLF